MSKLIENHTHYSIDISILRLIKFIAALFL